MALFFPRLLLCSLPVLLAVLFAAPSVASEQWTQTKASYAANDEAAQPAKQIDHASKRVRHGASLEEFFEIDDDAEQYFKSRPFSVSLTGSFALVVRPRTIAHRGAPVSHPPRAAYSTGPPHA
jgi:hypothetical protein